eukprot:SAG11_NODE_128_length_15542_cov_6.432105_14_plen_138_part_00
MQADARVGDGDAAHDYARALEASARLKKAGEEAQRVATVQAEVERMKVEAAEAAALQAQLLQLAELAKSVDLCAIASAQVDKADKRFDHKGKEYTSYLVRSGLPASPCHCRAVLLVVRKLTEHGFFGPVIAQVFPSG